MGLRYFFSHGVLALLWAVKSDFYEPHFESSSVSRKLLMYLFMATVVIVVGPS